MHVLEAGQSMSAIWIMKVASTLLATFMKKILYRVLLKSGMHLRYTFMVEMAKFNGSGIKHLRRSKACRKRTNKFLIISS